GPGSYLIDLVVGGERPGLGADIAAALTGGGEAPSSRHRSPVRALEVGVVEQAEGLPGELQLTHHLLHDGSPFLYHGARTRQTGATLTVRLDDEVDDRRRTEELDPRPPPPLGLASPPPAGGERSAAGRGAGAAVRRRRRALARPPPARRGPAEPSWPDRLPRRWARAQGGSLGGGPARVAGGDRPRSQGRPPAGRVGRGREPGRLPGDPLRRRHPAGHAVLLQRRRDRRRLQPPPHRLRQPQADRGTRGPPRRRRAQPSHLPRRPPDDLGSDRAGAAEPAGAAGAGIGGGGLSGRTLTGRET